jgi:hypothetical protein
VRQGIPGLPLQREILLECLSTDGLSQSASSARRRRAADYGRSRAIALAANPARPQLNACDLGQPRATSVNVKQQIAKLRPLKRNRPRAVSSVKRYFWTSPPAPFFRRRVQTAAIDGPRCPTPPGRPDGRVGGACTAAAARQAPRSILARERRRGIGPLELRSGAIHPRWRKTPRKRSAKG